MAVSFKETLHGFLSGYFDGSAHQINNVSQDFPQSQIVFDIHNLQRPVTLTIALIGDGTTDRREHHCTHPDPPAGTPVGLAKQLHGVQVQESVLRTLVIACPKQGTEFHRKLLDQTWGLLFALLETRRKELAALGIFSPAIPLMPVDETQREDIIEASGLFTCLIRARFARYEF